MAMVTPPSRRLALAAGTLGAGLIVGTSGMVAPEPASAYIGESFLEMPGILSAAASGERGKWLRIEGHYWPADEGGVFGGRNRLRRDKAFFGGPPAPKTGPGRLVLAIDKRNPHLAKVMQACAAKATVPQMRFSESSALARSLAEIGPRPAAMPETFEYRLDGVQFTACPAAAGAPEQAVVIVFKDIAWLNYSGPPEGLKLELTPASLQPVPLSGRTKAFVVSWFAVANDVDPAQCPAVNAKPTEEDFFALKPLEETARIKTELAAKKSGVSYEDEQMAHRGPMSLNVGLLPGIVRDPGHVVPQTGLARGLDLDGDDGRGRPPAGVCRHRNYSAPDGRKGIDNQLFTVLGCVPGFMGHKGFLMQYRNEQRRNGLLSILVIVSGIDDERNDPRIEVTLAYSKDPMAKSANGAEILHDYTYRLTERPEFTHYFARLPGRIENGAVVTELVERLQINPGLDPEVTLHKAGLRLEIMPDGKMKGVVAGYEDWRRAMALNANSRSESLYGFQAPGMYNAFKRYADGMKDPATGECRGISAAYDIEGSPAFIPPEDLRTHIALSVPASPSNR